MSNAAIRWAKEQTVRHSSGKLVLVLLADYANEKGACWPGCKRIAAESCMSEDTVQRRIKELVQDGLLFRADRGRRQNGSRLTLMTVVLFNAEAINYAVSLGLDAKFIYEKRGATFCLVGQGRKLRGNQGRKNAGSYIEPSNSKIEPSRPRRLVGHQRGRHWIVKGTQEWHAWVEYYKGQGLSEVFSVTSNDEIGEGRYEASLFPPSVQPLRR